VFCSPMLVIGLIDEESSALDPIVRALQYASLVKDEWQCDGGNRGAEQDIFLLTRRPLSGIYN